MATTQTRRDERLLIGGQWVEASGTGRFDVTNPANGEVVGSWRRTQRAAKVQLGIEPLRDIPASATTAVERAARRYGAFLEQPVELSP